MSVGVTPTPAVMTDARPGVRRAITSVTDAGTPGGTPHPTSVNSTSNSAAALPSAMHHGQKDSVSSSSA